MKIKLPKIKVKNPITGRVITAGNVFDRATRALTGVDIGIGSAIQDKITRGRASTSDDEIMDTINRVPLNLPEPTSTPLTDFEHTGRTIFGPATTVQGNQGITGQTIGIVALVAAALYTIWNHFKPNKRRYR